MNMKANSMLLDAYTCLNRINTTADIPSNTMTQRCVFPLHNKNRPSTRDQCTTLSVERQSPRVARFNYIYKMAEHNEPLEFLPVEKWGDLQHAFKAHWPRGVSGYAALEIQKRWKQKGTDYNFRVHCPFGDVWSGMVAVNEKEEFYEVIIQCPGDNIEELVAALRTTKLIDWTRPVIVPYATQNVVQCLQNFVTDINVDLDVHRYLNTYILAEDTFIEDESYLMSQLPPNMTFGLVTMEHLDLVDTTWPNRYANSRWHFELLIKNKLGYGLYLDNALVSWVFMKEVGPLQHLFTLEEHRGKGYAEMVLKLASKVWLQEELPVFAFCFQDNIGACKLYEKAGFYQGEKVTWCYLNKKQ